MHESFLYIFIFALGVSCLARGEIVIGFGGEPSNGKEVGVRGTKARLLSAAVILGSLLLFSGNPWGWLLVGTAYLTAIVFSLFLSKGER
jgi:hypothetical protein